MKKVLKISLGVLFLLILCGTFAFLWYKTRPVKEVYQIVVPQTRSRNGPWRPGRSSRATRF